MDATTTTRAMVYLSEMVRRARQVLEGVVTSGAPESVRRRAEAEVDRWTSELRDAEDDYYSGGSAG